MCSAPAFLNGISGVRSVIQGLFSLSELCDWVFKILQLYGQTETRPRRLAAPGAAAGGRGARGDNTARKSKHQNHGTSQAWPGGPVADRRACEGLLIGVLGIRNTVGFLKNQRSQKTK